MAKHERPTAEAINPYLVALNDLMSHASDCPCHFCEMFDNGYDLGRAEALREVRKSVEGMIDGKA